MSRRVAQRPKKKPKSRAEVKVETREALVSAALALFAKHGFDTPSLDDICDRAGFTRGAFYVHFRDRDDLVTAAMQRVGRVFLDGLLGAEGDDLAAIAQRFVLALESGAYPLTRKGGIRPYQLLDACARSRAIRTQYVSLVNETIRRLAEATRRGQVAKHVRADLSPDAIGLLLVTSVIGVQTLLDLDVAVDIPKSAAALLTLLRA
jgi:AcrR family transcriptional regulator